MIRAGIIGYGYWGPNVLRNLYEHPDIKVDKVCDLSEKRLSSMKEKYPSILTTTKAEEIFLDKNIDLVCVITPVFSHFQLAKQSLLNGKHLFIEKPMTVSSDQAKELIDIAEKKNLIIMVDHTFLFDSSVRKIKELVDNDSLGELLYYDSVRVNLGKFQHDVNVILDLAPHDISILNYIAKDIKPISVNAIGSKHLLDGVEDVAYLHVKFENNLIASFHVNWLSPVKIRQTIFAGDKKMLVWNDLSNDEKIKVYDKGVDVTTTKRMYDLLVNYRSGDMWSPQIQKIEALKTETQHLVDCIQKGKNPISDAVEGLKVVRILEAAQKSLNNGGMEILLKDYI